jgi:hypothetical protein
MALRSQFAWNHRAMSVEISTYDQGNETRGLEIRRSLIQKKNYPYVTLCNTHSAPQITVLCCVLSHAAFSPINSVAHEQ